MPRASRTEDGYLPYLKQAPLRGSKLPQDDDDDDDEPVPFVSPQKPLCGVEPSESKKFKKAEESRVEKAKSQESL